MSDESLEHNLLDDLAEEFVARYRRGERPALTEYANRHPDLADEIREVFPALVMMEQVRPEAGADLASGLVRSADGEKLERLGDYRILREVGRGGMGIVYEAEQESLGRHVALKVLPKHALLDPRHLQRFEREARAAARLHHTNIVPVFGVGEQHGLHYYVMQFIQGLGLDQVLVELKRLRKAKRVERNSFRSPPDQRNEFRSTSESASARDAARNDRDPAALSAVRAAEALISGQFHAAGGELKPVEASAGRSDASLRVGLSSDSSSSNIHLPGQPAHTTLSETGRQYWQSVARIGVQIADALAYADSQGVQHRDIKPSNLLLDTQGTVWVTDFGLAKATGSDDLTHTGDIVGTLRYLAPERLRGLSDPRSDTYSLGVTLYELITQRPAFEESDRTRLIRQIAQDEPRRPSMLEPELPLDLETIVLKAIAKEPADRYGTAADFASDLRRFLEDRPIHARRASPIERSWRWCRRNPLVASLSASLAVLVAVLGVGLGIGHLLRSERDRAVVSEVRAKQAEVEARDLLDRAVNAEREVKIRSHLAQATAYRRSGQPGRRYKCLSELAKAMELKPSGALCDELRNEAIACLALADLRAVDVPVVATIPSLVFDRSCEQYAFFDNATKIHVRRVGQSADVIVLPGVGSSRAGIWFSSSGRYVGAGGAIGGQNQIWQVESGSAVFPEPLQSYPGTCISPDERRMAMSMLNGSLVVYELPSGREIGRLATDTVPSAIAFHPDGRRLAVGLSRPPVVRIWDVDTDSVVAELRDIQAPIHAITWDSDGRRLALSLAWPAKRAEIWDAVTRERVAKLEGHAQDVIWSEFHLSGNVLVTLSWDGTTRVWDAHAARLLVAWTGGISPARDNDGHRIGHVWNHDQLQLVELITRDKYRTLVSGLGAGQGEYWEGGISPDGRLLAVGMDDGVRIWDLPSGQEVAYLPIDQIISPIFSPDGTELITSGLSGLLRWPITVVRLTSDRQPASTLTRSVSEDSASGTLSRNISEDISSSGTPTRNVIDGSSSLRHCK